MDKKPTMQQHSLASDVKSRSITHLFQSLSIPNSNCSLPKKRSQIKKKPPKPLNSTQRHQPARSTIVLNKKHIHKNQLCPICSMISNTHKEDYLAILTSALEGTVRQLAESSQINIKVRCELRSSHNTVQRQERLCTTNCS